jgi:hypothetical protein
LAPLIVVLAVFAFVIALLALPLGIRLSASFHGVVIFNMRIRCLFGLLTWELSSAHTRGDKPSVAGAEKAGRRSISSLLEAAKVRGIGSRISLLIGQLYRRIEIQSVKSDLRVSLGDDYYTGMLAGLLLPPVLYLNQRFDGMVLIQPAFEEDLFLEGDICGDLQVRPIYVLMPCLGFALSPEFRRARRIMAGGSCIKK